MNILVDMDLGEKIDLGVFGNHHEVIEIYEERRDLYLYMVNVLTMDELEDLFDRLEAEALDNYDLTMEIQRLKPRHYETSFAKHKPSFQIVTASF